MIVQNVGVKSHYAKNSLVFGQEQNTSSPIQNKKIGMNDFVFYRPKLAKSFLTFGEKKPIIEKSKDFADSLEKYYRLPPDPYQVKAASLLHKGSDVVVVAPTGTGKTMIAEYSIAKNLSEGKDSYYTAPLKALSNEKKRDFKTLFEVYDDLKKEWGNERVGLVTGDIQENPDAPIKVMTTEIYRNKLLGEDKSSLANLGTVIYDEFHTMNDIERGEVWETSVMYTPRNVQQLVLSGTVGNPETVTNWFNRLNVEKAKLQGVEQPRKAELVYMSSEERHVPLKYQVYDAKNQRLVPLMVEKYNIAKLEAAAKASEQTPFNTDFEYQASDPSKANQLFEKQKEVLRDISKAAKGEGTVEHGIETLKQIASSSHDNLEVLENDLNTKLGIEPLEAQRMAAHLSARDERRYNVEQLAHLDVDEKQQPKVVSRNRITQLYESGKMREESQNLLKDLSLKMKGDGTVQDGIKRLGGLINNQDLTQKDAQNRLISKKIDKNFARNITKALAMRPSNNQNSSVVHGLIDVLNKEDKLPAIFFKFSRAGCDELQDGCLKKGISLLDEQQQKDVEAVVGEYEKSGVFLGTDVNTKSFNSGINVHHAGKMPANKEIVEVLTQNKLGKVTFATSTIGAGLNFPSKSTVFLELRIKGEDLSSNEFHQMAGRSGRRGKDPVGNVILIPDKDHKPKDIYHMAVAPADNLRSNFKPQYSFISGYTALNKTAKTIGEAVDRSFLKDDLQARGINPDEVLNGVKDKFKNMSDLITSPDMECFTGKDGELVPTLKGAVVAKAKGVDGLVFANTLFHADLDKLAPEELASVACYMTEGKEKLQEGNFSLPKAAADSIRSIEDIRAKIVDKEELHGISRPIDMPNLYAAQFIQEWAKDSPDDSVDRWQGLVKKSAHPSFDEGDLFKSVNRTVDFLEQMRDSSNFVARNAVKNPQTIPLAKKMKQIAVNANVAISRMSQNPIGEVSVPISLEHLKLKR